MKRKIDKKQRILWKINISSLSKASTTENIYGPENRVLKRYCSPYNTAVEAKTLKLLDISIC